jgi:hypothetical protein
MEMLLLTFPDGKVCLVMAVVAVAWVKVHLEAMELLAAAAAAALMVLEAEVLVVLLYVEVLAVRDKVAVLVQ